MSFRRSTKQLSVLAILRKVDFMVLAVRSAGIQEETDKQFSSVKKFNNDHFIRNVVFSMQGLKSSVSDKSIGSRTNLKAYREYISKENTKFLCIDIDLDSEKVNEEKTDSIYVLYTFGYSLENDVFTKILLLQHLNDLLLNYVGRRKVVQEGDKLFLEFIRSSTIIMSDKFKFGKFRASFVTRLNSDRFVKLDKNGVKILFSRG